MTNDPAELALEADEELQQADELLESWASYTKDSNEFLVHVAENSGEDVLIQAALDANTQQRSLLVRARRHRRRNARLVKKQNRLLRKGVLEEAHREKTTRVIWPEFGTALISEEERVALDKP